MKRRLESFAPAGATRASRRLSFRCWTSQKSNIRVASETLESMTTFTRHHAFLKKAGENFHQGVARVAQASKKRAVAFATALFSLPTAGIFSSARRTADRKAKAYLP